jgi:hypothetical protein
MATVLNGRFTAHTDEPFVVFLIGMRINRLLEFRKWMPTAMAMGPMLRELYQHPEKGFLGGQTFLYWRGVAVVQYWRSFDDLERFARNPSDPHLPAWQRFNKTVGTNGSVGIWHETFMVPERQYEAIYNNMPVFGFAAATEHIPVAGKRGTARGRLDGQNEPAAASTSEATAPSRSEA